MAATLKIVRRKTPPQCCVFFTLIQTGISSKKNAGVWMPSGIGLKTAFRQGIGSAKQLCLLSVARRECCSVETDERSGVIGAPRWRRGHEGRFQGFESSGEDS